MKKGKLNVTRYIGQSLIIGDDIKVIMRGINGNQIDISIEAPKDISVHREEIYKKIQAQRVDEIVNQARKSNVRMNSRFVRSLKQSANDTVMPEDTINY